MKVYRIIVIIVAILIGISSLVFLFFAPKPQAAIHNPTTEEHYDLLKEEAMKVAKTLDRSALTDETLTADFYFNEDKLVVTVTSSKARLTAKIPMSNASYAIEDNIIIYKEVYEFENVKYEKENFLLPVWVYIILIILLSIILGYAVYFFFFKVWQNLSFKPHNKKDKSSKNV